MEKDFLKVTLLAFAPIILVLWGVYSFAFGFIKVTIALLSACGIFTLIIWWTNFVFNWWFKRKKKK